MPDLRITANNGQPAAHLRRRSDIVAPEPAGALRCCGAPWGLPGESDEEFAICPECREQKYGFERARSYGQYEGALVRAILLLKYERIEPLGRWFAERLLEVIRADEKRLWGDMVVSVPLHTQRKKERGFNQVELVRATAGEAPGDPLPAGTVDADASTARETSAEL